MVDTNWRYWQFLHRDTGAREWVGISRPDAWPRIDRIKVWTLLPDKAVFVANWFVSQDHQLDVEERHWEHDSITGWDFCDAAIEAPLPSADDLRRITRPEAVLEFAQIDRIPLKRIVGLREANRIADGRR
ncbi:hypothetical protein [Gordonia bronchialis]|jgi:hypothetical protein|uniref:hypothetical protein n=1 Tax=Gordonia bronchialis TaxID=2054 RepID=UPI002270FAF6|nr:hypothetical protein [Gordonia bronchialis]